MQYFSILKNSLCKQLTGSKIKPYLTLGFNRYGAYPFGS